MGARVTGRVVVAGVGRSGVTTLIEAIGIVDPHLSVDRIPGDGGSGAAVGLLVIDPASIAGEEERAVLRRIRADVGVAAIVCTKVDAFWDWPTITKASRAVLDPDADLPVFAVSGAAAVAGAADESGVDELVAWIREQADRVGHLDPTPHRSVLAEVDRDDQQRAVEVSASRDELAATRSRLVRSRDRGRADRLGALRGGLNRMRSAAVADLDAGIRDIGARAREAVAGLRRDGVEDYASWLGDAVGELRGRLDAAVRDDLDRIRSVALLGVEPVPTRPSAPTVREPLTLRPHTDRRRGAEDALVVLFGASAGIAIGRLVVTPLSQVHTLQWISMPLALVVGVGVAAVVVRVRRIGALRAQMRGWTTEALAESRAGIERDIVGEVAAAESVVAGQVMRHYERRMRMIADYVARVDADIRAVRSAGTGSAVRASKVPGNA